MRLGEIKKLDDATYTVVLLCVECEKKFMLVSARPFDKIDPKLLDFDLRTGNYNSVCGPCAYPDQYTPEALAKEKLIRGDPGNGLIYPGGNQ